MCDVALSNTSKLGQVLFNFKQEKRGLVDNVPQLQ